MPAAMSGEHVRTRSGPRRWVIVIVCVVVARPRGRRLRRRRPAAQQPGLRHAGRPASRADRRLRLADRRQRRRRLHRHRAVLHRPRPGQPHADAQPAGRRLVGRVVAVAARVPGERAARARARPRRSPSPAVLPASSARRASTWRSRSRRSSPSRPAPPCASSSCWPSSATSP